MSLFRLVLAFFSLVLAVGVPGHAAGLTDDMAKRLQEIGRVVDPDGTAPLYLPFQQREPYAGVAVERDIPYAPAPLQKLDVFSSEGSSRKPVLVFVHGGAFRGGDKHRPGSPFYDNVMLWATQHGMVGVNVNYRLAPAAPYPAAEEDLADALRWVIANIATRGGDPTSIILLGHLYNDSGVEAVGVGIVFGREKQATGANVNPIARHACNWRHRLGLGHLDGQRREPLVEAAQAGIYGSGRKWHEGLA